MKPETKKHQNILEIKNLVKDYGSLRAVNNVSFEIKKGEIFGLLGSNGAGKTTLISSIMTLEEPSEGLIKVGGFDVQKNPRQAKSITGFMPQELIIHGYFSVIEVIRFYSGFCGVIPDHAHIEYLLRKLSLWDKRHVGVRSLSGGMKRRLLMVKALVHKPKLLLLDEPTAGVDIQLRTLIWDFVKDLKREGVSILFTTHYLEEAEKLCDRVAFMNEGKIQSVGNTRELISNLTVRQLAVQLKKPQSIQHKNYLGLEEDYHMFDLPSSKDMSLGNFIKEELCFDMDNIMDIKVREGRLEDVFQKVLAQDS